MKPSLGKSGVITGIRDFNAYLFLVVESVSVLDLNCFGVVLFHLVAGLSSWC